VNTMAKFALPALFVSAIFASIFACAQQSTVQAAAQHSIKPVAALSPYIDVHSHMDISDPQRSVRSALDIMALANAKKIVFMPSPFTPGDKVMFEAEAFMAAVKKHPDKMVFLAGGGTLNPMIQEAAVSGASPEMQRQFREQAEKLLSEGAVGFGEISAEHVPSAASPSYMAAPPDGTLFMILADIAAQHDVIIDLHMEAAPQDMPLPSDLKSPPNPPTIHGNIAALERLLSHNPRAKIVWAHAGSTDDYGTRTPELCRRLLAAHTNLYMEIKVDPLNLGKNPVIAGDGKIKLEWMKLFQDFPDRFLIGSDQIYPLARPSEPQRWQAIVLLFNQLPADLRKKIGLDNPTRLYFGKH